MNRKLSLVIIVLTVVSALFGSARSKWDDDARKRKADYLFLESERQWALDSLSSAFYLLERTYQFDTTDTHVGARVGKMYTALGRVDQNFPLLGLSLLHTRFIQEPGDRENSEMVGHLFYQIGFSDGALNVWSTLDSLYPENISYSMMHIESLLQSGDSLNLRRAVERINQLEPAFGPSVLLTARKAGALLELDDSIAAIAEVDSLLVRSPREVDNFTFAGDFYAELNLPEKAIYYYDRACELDSTNGNAIYSRAEFYHVMNDSVAFNRETTNALINTDLDSEVKYDILLNYVKAFYADSTQIDNVNTLFEKVIDRNPHDAAFRDLYASYLYTIRKVEPAIEQMEICLNIDPTNVDRWRQLVYYALIAGDNAKAIEVAESAVALFPEDAQLLTVYGEALQQVDDYEKAVEQFRRALELTPSWDNENSLMLYTLIGDAEHVLGHIDEAIETYEAGLRIDSSNADLLNNYAYMLATSNRDLDLAEKHAAYAILLEPNNGVFLDTYAWVMFMKRDYKAAADYINRALENVDEANLSSEYYEHAGDIYFMLGEPDKALEYWKQALELDPDNALLQKKIKHKAYFYE